ncbi:MAG TPA: glycosyltransferase family 2 protein, partial [Nitrososphaera sp.]|nr:glycosyltransferase family 2 protein [Nitrososphaera sp.]
MQEQRPLIDLTEQTADSQTGSAMKLAWETESAPQVGQQDVISSMGMISASDETNERAKTVSVIILNYNGREDTKSCLLSLGELDFPREQLEIIVVDNGSSDGSTDMLRSEFPQVRVIENETNLGFSRAANQAAAEAKGEYLAFLNNDMRVAKGWLKAMLQVVRPADGIVCAGSTILNWDGTAIDFMGRPNDAFCLYYDSSEIPPTPDDLPFPDKYALFVSCGAAIIQSKVFRELGGFEPDFFLYQEDVDLGWRLWLKGYKVVLSSRSFVFHRSGASSSKLPAEFIYKLNRKHALFSVFKNLEKDTLREIFPQLLYYILERSRFMIGAHEAIESVIKEFESSIDSWILKRQAVQKGRVKTDAEIFSFPGHPLNFLCRGQHYQSARNRLAEYS